MYVCKEMIDYTNFVYNLTWTKWLLTLVSNSINSHILSRVIESCSYLLFEVDGTTIYFDYKTPTIHFRHIIRNICWCTIKYVNTAMYCLNIKENILGLHVY
jgi:hypothetical protein